MLCEVLSQKCPKEDEVIMNLGMVILDWNKWKYVILWNLKDSLLDFFLHLVKYEPKDRRNNFTKRFDSNIIQTYKIVFWFNYNNL